MSAHLFVRAHSLARAPAPPLPLHLSLSACLLHTHVHAVPVDAADQYKLIVSRFEELIPDIIPFDSMRTHYLAMEELEAQRSKEEVSTYACIDLHFCTSLLSSRVAAAQSLKRRSTRVTDRHVRGIL